VPGEHHITIDNQGEDALLVHWMNTWFVFEAGTLVIADEEMQECLFEGTELELWQMGQKEPPATPLPEADSE